MKKEFEEWFNSNINNFKVERKKGKVILTCGEERLNIMKMAMDTEVSITTFYNRLKSFPTDPQKWIKTMRKPKNKIDRPKKQVVTYIYNTMRFCRKDGLMAYLGVEHWKEIKDKVKVVYEDK